MQGAPKNDYPNDIKPDQSANPFNESISSIAWSPNNNRVFATTSWDGEMRIFEVIPINFILSIVQKIIYKFPQPALKCTWNDQSTQLYVGLMDGAIKCYDIATNQIGDLGKHNSAISSLHFVPGMNALISSAYEQGINVWQIGNPTPGMVIDAGNRVLASDFQFPLLIAGTAGEKIMITDITNTSSKSIFESSQLGKNSQIQSIAINHKGTMFGIGSFDGRSNISSVVKSVTGSFSGKTAITFKCNKQEEGGNTILYPVNSIGFNSYNDRWFMTAGSDGVMHFWDYEAKNKIKTFSYGGIPITTAKVNSTGDMVAYCLGNDWSLGCEGKWETKLGAHHILEGEMKFKS